MSIFVSRSLDYALRSLIHLAKEPGSSANLRELSEIEHIPRSYLAKVMRTLVVANLVDSDPGVTGGYHLKRPAKDISLREIYESIEGNFRTVICTDTHDTCELKSDCRQVPVWLKLETKILELLEQWSLQDFVGQLGKDQSTTVPTILLKDLKPAATHSTRKKQYQKEN